MVSLVVLNVFCFTSNYTLATTRSTLSVLFSSSMTKPHLGTGPQACQLSSKFHYEW